MVGSFFFCPVFILLWILHGIMVYVERFINVRNILLVSFSVSLEIWVVGRDHPVGPGLSSGSILFLVWLRGLYMTCQSSNPGLPYGRQIPHLFYCLSQNLTFNSLLLIFINYPRDIFTSKVSKKTMQYYY